MDRDFINRLKKKIDDLYLMKYQHFLNAKDFGDLREHQGFIKAIKLIGELIDNNEEKE